jgi:hypothetical protein
MDQSPLVNEQIAAGYQFLRDFERYAPIKAAFWLKEEDERQCHLYVASDQINDKNFDLAYGEVGALTQKMEDPHLEVLDVRLVWGDDRLVQAAAELRQRYPKAKAIHYRNKMFAGRDVDELYLYPPLTPAPVA